MGVKNVDLRGIMFDVVYAGYIEAAIKTCERSLSHESSDLHQAEYEESIGNDGVVNEVRKHYAKAKGELNDAELRQANFENYLKAYDGRYGDLIKALSSVLPISTCEYFDNYMKERHPEDSVFLYHFSLDLIEGETAFDLVVRNIRDAVKKISSSQYEKEEGDVSTMEEMRQLSEIQDKAFYDLNEFFKNAEDLLQESEEEKVKE